MSWNTLITAAELQVAIEQSDLVILDCRFNLMDTATGEQAYAAGHIPGAHYLHLDNDLSSPITETTGRHPLPNLEQLANKLGSLGINATTQVVAYDDCGGAMASRCWWLLRYLGHEKVALLDGGINAWLQNSEALETTVPNTRTVTFKADVDSHQNLAVDQILAAQNHGAVLVDARSAERFRGEQEPIDPVAGHIPGALNRPMTDNLVDGFFKPAAQLRDEWLAVLGDQQPDQVVHMCGSGVTACHNLLAMEIAGLQGSRLYAGSWSEWIRDPARPVAP